MEKEKWIRIGNKSEWENSGKYQNGKIIWKPKSQSAEKADPSRGFFCCDEYCNALIVNQGAKNEWFFSRKNIVGNRECLIQKNIAEFSNSRGEGQKHKLAKEIMFNYLNSKSAKERYGITDVYMEESFDFDGIEIRPDITLVTKDGDYDYVEIVNHSSPHRNPNAWAFYKDHTQKLIIIDVKGNQRGWDYEVESIRNILIKKFERTFYTRDNIIKMWENANKVIQQKYQMETYHFEKYEQYLLSIKEDLKVWNNELNQKIKAFEQDVEKLQALINIIENEDLNDFDFSSEEKRQVFNELSELVYRRKPLLYLRSLRDAKIFQKYHYKKTGDISKDDIENYNIREKLEQLGEIIPKDCEFGPLLFGIKDRRVKNGENGKKQGYYAWISSGSLSRRVSGTSEKVVKNFRSNIYRYKDFIEGNNDLHRWKINKEDYLKEVSQVQEKYNLEIEKIRQLLNERKKKYDINIVMDWIAITRAMNVYASSDLEYEMRRGSWIRKNKRGKIVWSTKLDHGSPYEQHFSYQISIEIE